MVNLQNPARQPLDIAATVWMVANKTGFTLFATEEQAQRYVSSFAASVGGGMHISSVPVFGVAAPVAAAAPGAVPVGWCVAMQSGKIGFATSREDIFGFEGCDIFPVYRAAPGADEDESEQQAWKITIPTLAHVQVYERALAAYVAEKARAMAAFRGTTDFEQEAVEFHKAEHDMAAALHQDLATMLPRVPTKGEPT